MRAKNTGVMATALLLGACQHVPEVAVATQEQHFSDRAQQSGYQQAFIEFFRRDGVALQPHPLTVHEVFPTQPRDPNNFEWTPHFSFSSSDGDVSFTSGPWVYRDNNNQTLATGYFCSTWRFDGQRWQVAIDAGGAAPREWKKQRVRAWRTDGKHRANDLPRSAQEMSTAEVASDAIWQWPGEALKFDHESHFDFGGAELMLLSEHIAQSRDMATALYEWREGNFAHYVHTAWRAENGRWVLQIACIGGAPLM